MQKNLVKTSLLANEPSAGCWLTLASGSVAEALSHCGFDWLVIDMEHAPNDPLSVVDQLRAIEAAHVRGSTSQPVVRVTENNPELVKRAMDAGCESIIFPNVNTADEARRAVASMRFPQGSNGGLRGVAGLVRAGSYGLDREFVGMANSQACTIVQIESAEAVANAREIAAVEGVDCLFIGTADLSASLGHLGQPGHTEVLAAIRAVVAAAAEAGKAVGAFSVSVDDAAWYRSEGVQFLALHSDVAWLTRGAIAAREGLAAALSQSAVA